MKTYQKMALLLTLTFFFVAGLVSSAGAAGYPSKNIVWIVSSAPGGGFDTYARAVAPYLSKYLPNHVNIIIKNVTGAGGLTGASQIFQSPPDGYTIGYIYYPGIAIIQMERNIGFDPSKMVPIAQIATDAQGLFVSAKSNIKTLADLQKKNLVKILTQPRGVTMYSFNVIAEKMFGLKARFVTGYKGGSGVSTGLMRGDGDMGILNLSHFYRYVQSGDLRVILTFTKKRTPLTPNVPCVGELGYPKATACKSWKVIFGPPGLPADITATLQEAFKKSLEDPQLKAWAAKAKSPFNYQAGQTAWKELQEVFKTFKQYS